MILHELKHYYVLINAQLNVHVRLHEQTNDHHFYCFLRDESIEYE